VNKHTPELIFVPPLDERGLFEAQSRGYLGHAAVRYPDGATYQVTFYDCTRLAQDLEYEVSTGRMCVADIGMIVIPEVTLSNMQIAVTKLSAEGYFESLRPTEQ
jgi:hypothetical protein